MCPPDFAFPHLSAGITSLCTVALIAVERMFVVCKPLGQITFQKKHAIGGIALSWLWSLTWNLPPLFGWGRYELEGVGTSCAPDWHNRDPHNVSYILAYFAVCFAAPFAIILASYAKLMWTLHQVSKFVTIQMSMSCWQVHFPSELLRWFYLNKCLKLKEGHVQQNFFSASLLFHRSPQIYLLTL